eukprot:1145484-Pelagomonas_calceolata.AAC.1
MARLVEASLCAYCTEWAWSFCASLGMGSIDSPTHTQGDYVESGLGKKREKMEKRKGKNNIGSEDSEDVELYHLRKRRHIGSRSREPPSPGGKREASVGLAGFWQHAAPGNQCYVELNMAVLDVQLIKLPGWSCAGYNFFISSHTAEYPSLVRPFLAC